MVKVNSCVFISGKGTNLKKLILNSKTYTFPIRIKLIVSSNINAEGLKFARKWSIPYLIMNNKRLTENKILINLKKQKIDLILLAGFMKILSKNFIRKFRGKILNIHPSLLPKFKGLDTFNRVLRANEKFTGCTVHFVDEKLDSGKIIIKKRIIIKKNFNHETLKKGVQIEEYKAYSEAIRKIYSAI